MARIKIMLLALMLILLAPAIFAKTNIFSTSVILSQNTTDDFCQGGCYRQQHSVIFTMNELNSINKNNGMNFYARYGCDSIEEFNERNGAITQVDRVVFRTTLSRSLVGLGGSQFNTTTINTSRTIQPEDTPFTSFKEFITLYNKEPVTITMDTFFVNSTQIVQDSPCSFEIVLGTSNCNRCPELEFQEMEQDVQQANSLRDMTDNIITRISSIFLLNFEFIVTLFWIFMISSLLLTLLFIILLIFSPYLIARYFKKVMKK